MHERSERMMDARATRESTRDKWDLGEVTETHGSETGHLLGGIGQHFKLTGSLFTRTLRLVGPMPDFSR